MRLADRTKNGNRLSLLPGESKQTIYSPSTNLAEFDFIARIYHADVLAGRGVKPPDLLGARPVFE